MAKKAPKIPIPAKRNSRICFGLAWFTTEDDAQRYHNHVRQSGRTYNGGYFHGMLCGRAPEFDYTDATLGPLFAVTD